MANASTEELIRRNRKKIGALTESAVLVAFATVLSLIKLVHLPYGGSVTLASMLPILLVSYRYGVWYGLGAGLVHGIVQQLLGLDNVAYFTTWQSILVLVLLDYLVAFAVIGLGGIFRRFEKKWGISQSTALVCGSILVCVLRYICHVITGATIWAGISIPTAAALIYSLSYNATYMVPETIVLAVTAGALGSILDFKKQIPERIVREKKGGVSPLLPALRVIGVVSVAVAVIFPTVRVLPLLQDPESGAFSFVGFSQTSVSDFVDVIVVVALCLALAIASWVLSRRFARTDNK